MGISWDSVNNVNNNNNNIGAKATSLNQDNRSKIFKTSPVKINLSDKKVFISSHGLQ